MYINESMVPEMHNGRNESTKTYTYEQIIDRIVKNSVKSNPCGSLACSLSHDAKSVKGKAVMAKYGTCYSNP
jgi:hypothetical protein